MGEETVPACRCAWQKALGKLFNLLQGSLAVLLNRRSHHTPLPNNNKPRVDQAVCHLGALSLSLAVVSPGQPPALSLCLELSLIYHLISLGQFCPAVPLSPRGGSTPGLPLLAAMNAVLLWERAGRQQLNKTQGGMAASAQRGQCSRQGRPAGRIPAAHQKPCTSGSSLGRTGAPSQSPLWHLSDLKNSPALALLARQWT